MKAPKILWTPEEDEKLRAVYGKAPHTELLELFPGRTLDSIRSHAAYRKLRGKRKNGPSHRITERHAARPPATKVYKALNFDPRPCSERELGYER